MVRTPVEFEKKRPRVHVRAPSVGWDPALRVAPWPWKVLAPAREVLPFEHRLREGRTRCLGLLLEGVGATQHPEAQLVQFMGRKTPLKVTKAASLKTWDDQLRAHPPLTVHGEKPPRADAPALKVVLPEPHLPFQVPAHL